MTINEQVEVIDFRDRNLVFIDLETTGLDKDTHEILEVGCLIVDGRTFNIKEEYFIKTAPQHIDTADKKALKLCGYSAKKWKNAVDLKTAMVRVLEMSKSGMIAGWNVSFDWGFIEKSFKELGLDSHFNYHKVDIQAIAYSVLYNDKKVTRLGLRHVASRFDYQPNTTHSAGEDIKLTYEIFLKLMSLLK